MCTLTYLTTANGFILTHNRDERKDRPATKAFIQEEHAAHSLLFPQDLEAKGSWFVYHNKASLCVLNGGTSQHRPNPPYKHSRGLVPLHFFQFASAEAFAAQYNFEGIEPFTLVAKTEKGLFKIVHDMDQTQIFEFDPTKAHIWSSTQLFTPEVRKKREQWFEQWRITQTKFTPESIRSFHLNAGDGDEENDLKMSRWGLLKTVSLTQVHQEAKTSKLYYHNFEFKEAHQLLLS